MYTCSTTSTLAYNLKQKKFKTAGISIQHSYQPIKINMTMRESVHLMCTISEVYVTYELNSYTTIHVYQQSTNVPVKAEVYNIWASIKNIDKRLNVCVFVCVLQQCLTLTVVEVCP